MDKRNLLLAFVIAASVAIVGVLADEECIDALPTWVSASVGNCPGFKDDGQCGKPWVAAFCQATCGCPKPTAEIDGADVSDLYSKSVADAAKKLIKRTPSDQLESLVFPYDSPARTMSKNGSVDPRFAAVFARSAPWGVAQCSMSFEQLIAMHEMLDAALSPGGYQQVVSIMNHQVIIGEMEDTASGQPNIVSDITKLQLENNDETLYENVTAAADANGVDPAVTPVVVAGAVTNLDGSTSLNWTWARPPGSAARVAQFCNFSMAIFGKVCEDCNWGFRFEGHHLSINFDSRRGDGSTAKKISLTPMLLGSFPMVVTPAPDPTARLETAWALSSGQRLLASAAVYLRDMWLGLPNSMRRKAYVKPENFPQVVPLLNDIPTPNGFIGLYANNTFNPEGPFLNLTVLDLSEKTLSNMYSFMDIFLGTMHTTVAASMRKRLNDRLSGGDHITMFWAGGSLRNDFTNHYSYIKAGPFQFEYVQSGQFILAYPGYEGNHVHTMLRDLEYDWDYDPMDQHHRNEHMFDAMGEEDDHGHDHDHDHKH